VSDYPNNRRLQNDGRGFGRHVVCPIKFKSEIRSDRRSDSAYYGNIGEKTLVKDGGRLANLVR
jgi:hypothetical protein